MNPIPRASDAHDRPGDLPPLPPTPPVSIVMPVLNESRHLEEAVRRALSQDYEGELELVIALGPSTDDTDEIAARLAASDPRVRTVPNPSGRTPAALNAAITVARHPVIVRVDGHGILPPEYVRTAVALLSDTGAANVGGIMHAEGTTAFEEAVAGAMTSKLGVGNARFHTGGGAGPSDTVYLGVFRREVLERLGGYNEEFIRAQDWELNYRIREAGHLVWFSPDLRVSYRPRPTVKALAKQYFHYGRWRRVVTRHHRGSVNPRYLAAPAALVAVVGGTVAGAAGFRRGFVLPAGYAAAILAGSAWEGRGLKPSALVRLPVAMATMHGSWAVGFLTSPRALAEKVAEGTAGDVGPGVRAAAVEPAGSGLLARAREIDAAADAEVEAAIAAEREAGASMRATADDVAPGSGAAAKSGVPADSAADAEGDTAAGHVAEVAGGGPTGGEAAAGSAVEVSAAGAFEDGAAGAVGAGPDSGFFVVSGEGDLRAPSDAAGETDPR